MPVLNGRWVNFAAWLAAKAQPEPEADEAALDDQALGEGLAPPEAHDEERPAPKRVKKDAAAQVMAAMGLTPEAVAETAEE